MVPLIDGNRVKGSNVMVRQEIYFSCSHIVDCGQGKFYNGIVLVDCSIEQAGMTGGRP